MKIKKKKAIKIRRKKKNGRNGMRQNEPGNKRIMIEDCEKETIRKTK